MSNRENPSSGYLIEASKLAVFIPDTITMPSTNAWRNTISTRLFRCWTKPFLTVWLVQRRCSFSAIQIRAMGTWRKAFPMPISTRTICTKNGRSQP